MKWYQPKQEKRTIKNFYNVMILRLENQFHYRPELTQEITNNNYMSLN